MKFSIEGRCVLELEHNPGEKQSKHVSTKFNLDVSPNLDKTQYLNSEDLPTAYGTKALTAVFVQGLIGNIHQAHENKMWDSADHLRYIIAELEKGFVEVVKVNVSKF